MRMTRAWLAASSFACAFALLGSRAEAQDLVPPSTGTPSSGDTATPPPAAGTPPPEGTRLDADEKKDSGRGLEWFYLNASVGYSYANMSSLSSSNLTPSIQSASSAGPAFGAGLGIRLFIVSIGAQATLNELSNFNLWQMDAQLSLHIPIGHWEPYFGLHGGYCFVAAFDAAGLADGISGSPNVSITGGDGGLQLGLDYYFNHFVSLGIEGDGSVLFLHRPPTTLPTALESQLTSSQLAAYQQSGDSVGLGVIGSVHLGFHL